MTIEACDVCNKIIEYTNDYLLSCSKLYANAVKYSEKIINYTKTLFLNCVKCVIPILYRINIEKYDNSNTMHILFQCDYDKNELPTLFVIKFNRYHELGFNVLPALLITSNKAASIIQYVIDNITEEETAFLLLKGIDINQSLNELIKFINTCDIDLKGEYYGK